MPRRACAVVAAAVLVLAAAGCGGGGDEAGGGRLTVFAASSLSEVLPALEPEADYSFAGSDALAAQIRAGAAADVYVSAAVAYPEALRAEGLVEPPRVFARNRLVVIVPSANPAGIGSVEDLGRPGVRLVLAADSVPAGDYARRALAALGESGALANVASEEPDVASVVGKIALGAADAAIVYATDAVPVADQVAVLAIPPSAQPTIEYAAAVVAGSPRRGRAVAFLDMLVSPAGREALAAAGFGLP